MKIFRVFLTIFVFLSTLVVSWCCTVQTAYAVSADDYGTHGRLSIPDLSIGVRLYDGGNGTSQGIVDADNSAAYMKWIEQDAIADHSLQANFCNLLKASPGRTVAYIDTLDYSEAYVCVSVQIGHIREMSTDGSLGRRIFDSEYHEIYSANKGGICMYSCLGYSAEDVMDVALTYWQPVSDNAGLMEHVSAVVPNI